MTTYSNIKDLIDYEIEPALDNPEDFDVMGIARDVSAWSKYGLVIAVDEEGFWDAVQRNQRVKTYEVAGSNGKTIDAYEDGRSVIVRSARRSSKTGEYGRERKVLKATNGRLFYLDGEGKAHQTNYRFVKRNIFRG